MRYAYLIGSNGPSEAGRLRYAQPDAARLARVLGEPACGFSTTLAGTKDSASLIRDKLYALVESCSLDDVLLCAFSGHGILEAGELYLLLETTDLSRLLATSLGIVDIVRAIHYCKAKSKLLILDCCHAGAVTSMLGLRGAEGVPFEEVGVPKEHFLILMASGRLERARELRRLGAGFLTDTIVKALKNNREIADTDHERDISRR